MWSEALTNKTITTGNSETTKHIHLFDFFRYHMLEYKITGSGKATIEAFTSISGETWVSSGVTVRKATSLSGPGGDGKDIILINLRPGEFVRFIISATDADIVITLWFSQK